MVNHEETGIFNPVVHFSNWIYNYVVEGSGRRVLVFLSTAAVVFPKDSTFINLKINDSSPFEKPYFWYHKHI